MLSPTPPPADNPAALRLAPLLDALALGLASYAAWWWRFERGEMPPNYLTATVLGMLLALVLLPAARAYRSALWSHPLRGVIAAGPGVIAVFASLVLLAALTKSTADFSRLWMAGWLALALLAMALWRLGCRPLSASPLRQVLVLGSGKLAGALCQRLAASPRVRVVGCVSLPRETRAVARDDAPATLPLGKLDELEGILAASETPVDELWLAPDQAPGPGDEDLVTRLRLYSLPVRYVPDLSVLQLIGQRPSQVEGITLIELNATPLDGPDALIKAVMDRVLSALLLVLLSPLLLGIALAIRLDSPGPVLFRQPRHGGGGRIIPVLKFRSMFHHDNPGDHRQASRDDPRITRVGAFLRRSSLDELPQLINVLRGEMSLVGPRPHPVALNEEYALRLGTFMQRHRVLPGITGWAQINGYRGETDTLEKMAGRLQHDLYYIEHWSLGLDLYILMRTALIGWGGRNAY